MLLDFSSTQKSYILYSLSQQKILVSRDVTFKDETYPFAVQQKKLHVLLYPINPLLDTSECDYEELTDDIHEDLGTRYEQ